jgi:hypothetical protein
MKVRGIQWYYYLIPKENERDKSKALFSAFPRSSCINKFIVCWDHYDEVHKKKSKLYTVFEHYLDFAIYFLKIEPKMRSFYEIILGERIQKPHFDVDMDLTDQQIRDGVDKKVIEDLIRVIISLIPKICIETDICIYSSHDIENNSGINKRSYHIIVNRFCHANNKEAKAFYYTVMSKLPKEYFDNRWIDHSVYSKTQQFRIYNSKKLNSNRVKIFHHIWEFEGKTIVHVNNEANKEGVEDNENLKFLQNLEESVVSARPSNCIPLPSFDTPSEFVKTKNYEKGEDLEYDLAMEAINLLAHSVGTTPESDNFPFSFDKIEGPFVILKRRKASKCRLCCRTHSHQNPYLLITPDTKNVFFHCRRAPANKNLYIGSLLSEEEKDVSVLKSLEVVIGNPNTVIEDKKNDNLKNNWSLNKLEKLKELAASSNPDPGKKTIKKQPKAADPEVVSSIISKIANERSK